MTKIARRPPISRAGKAAAKVTKRAGAKRRDSKRASQGKPSQAQPKTGDVGSAEPAKKSKYGKVIRDSFTMPLADYQLIHALRQRCIELGASIKKSELLRAGLRMLQGLPSDHLKAVVKSVESVKTGRPPTKKVNHAKRKKQ